MLERGHNKIHFIIYPEQDLYDKHNETETVVHVACKYKFNINKVADVLANISCLCKTCHISRFLALYERHITCSSQCQHGSI